jgi:hypothetical protein
MDRESPVLREDIPHARTPDGEGTVWVLFSIGSHGKTLRRD